MASNNRRYHAKRFCLALPFTHECVIRRMVEPAKRLIAAATIKEPVGCRRTRRRKPMAVPVKSCCSPYDAVASSLSAVLVAQLSITSELWRPVLRTEEAAVRSAPAVSFRTSSSFLAAVCCQVLAVAISIRRHQPRCEARKSEETRHSEMTKTPIVCDERSPALDDRNCSMEFLEILLNNMRRGEQRVGGEYSSGERPARIFNGLSGKVRANAEIA